MQSSNLEKLRNGIMGFGEEHSSHKMYYPELQKKLSELNRFKILIDNISDIIIQVDLNKDIIIEFNNTAIKMLGYEKSEFINLSIDSIIKHNIYAKIKSYSLSGTIKGKSDLLLTELISKSGKIIPVELNYQYQEFNNTYFAIIIARSIEEKVSSEKKLIISETSLRAVFDNTYDAIMIHDYEGNLIEANQQMFNMFGVNYANFKDFSINEYSANLNMLADIPTIIDKSKDSDFFVFEWTSRRPIDNSTFDSEIALRKINWYGKELMLAIIRDITERKNLELTLKSINFELEDRVKARTIELENALADYRKEIQIRKGIETHLVKAKEELSIALEKEKELNILKSQFVSMVSHEYRTPLTVILSSTYLLEIYFKHNKEEDFLKHLNQIQGAVHDMTKMLDDVIKIGKISAGDSQLELSEFNLNDAINEVVNIVSSNDSNSHKFDLKFNSSNNPILTDYKVLHHIIINVLVNALKFSKKESIVKVIVESEDNYYNITIADQGIGIRNEDIRNIFEPFFRSNNIGNVPGTGLGLSIVKNSVDMLGGNIRIDSQLSVGTIVYINIPRCNSVALVNEDDLTAYNQ